MWHVVGIRRSASGFMLHHFAEWGATSNRGSASRRACDLESGVVDVVADMLDLLFAVQVSADDVVSFDEGVELSLEVLVLLREEKGMLLEGLVL